MSIIPVLGGGLSKAAFSNELFCPYCNSKKWKFVENIGRTRVRYRCKNCRQTIQYDFSNRPDEHPYAALQKAKWQKIVERSKTPSRSKLLIG